MLSNRQGSVQANVTCFKAIPRNTDSHQIEVLRESPRGMMPWIAKNKLAGKAKDRESGKEKPRRSGASLKSKTSS
jgi:hypothetical protein